MIYHAMQAVVAFVLVLGPLVFIHELGHFLVAKALGIGVPVFSLGFGPRLAGFRRRETDYRLSLIPLGGYVRLAGDEADEQRTGAPDEFLSRPKGQRFLVFVAGASFNFVLAFLAIWLLLAVWGRDEVPETYPVVAGVSEGSPAERAGVRLGDTILAISGRDVKDPEVFFSEIALSPNVEKTMSVERDGARLELRIDTGEDPKFGWGSPGFFASYGAQDEPVIDSVVPGDPAERAGIRAGDRILAAGGRRPINQVELRLLLQNSAGRELPVRVEREGRELELTVTPRERGGKGWIGVGFRPPATVRRDLGIAEAALEAGRMNLAMSQTLFVVLKRLVTRELPLRSMSGPIGIAQFARQALIAGPESFLYLLGFFSLQLGILNLLPIPVLDGGHILILGVESLIRRDLSDTVKERVMQAGFVFLLAFMGVIVYLDVVKSF